jgi:hypothetical protein
MSRVDRTGWPPGPWDREPDDLTEVHHGLVCEFRRCRHGGWHAVIVVPSWHASYDRPPQNMQDVRSIDEVQDLAHEVRYGFDCCNHYLDLAPVDAARNTDSAYVYKTLDYTRMEARKLAKQIAARSVVKVVATQIADAVVWGAKRLSLRAGAFVLSHTHLRIVP